MIFSFYIYSQYLVMIIIIPYISTVLSTLRQAPHLSPPPPPTHKRKKKGKKKEKQWQHPWHPAQSVDFLCSSVVPFLIDNPVLTGNVHLIRCYKNRLHGANHPYLKATGTFSIKFWSLIVLSLDFFICPQLFGGWGPQGPKTEIPGLNTAVYMFKVMVLLNNFFRNQLSNFYQISCWSYCWNRIQVCSNGHASFMPINIWWKNRIIIKKKKTTPSSDGEAFISCMTELENCCITAAYLQWLFHSGELAMARGPFIVNVEALVLIRRRNKKKYLSRYSWHVHVWRIYIYHLGSGHKVK